MSWLPWQHRDIQKDAACMDAYIGCLEAHGKFSIRFIDYMPKIECPFTFESLRVESVNCSQVSITTEISVGSYGIEGSRGCCFRRSSIIRTGIRTPREKLAMAEENFLAISAFHFPGGFSHVVQLHGSHSRSQVISKPTDHWTIK